MISQTKHIAILEPLNDAVFCTSYQSMNHTEIFTVIEL